jgi:hypothetical protein
MSAAAATRAPLDRADNDFYATPRSAIAQLLDVEHFDGVVWEPACGDGAICRVMKERGLNVVGTDLVNRGWGGAAGVDFLMEHRTLGRHIVTNPPFNLGTDFVRHALSICSGKVVMLLKIGFIEGPTKADLHAQLARVWVIRRRVTFLKNGHEFSRSGGKGGIHTYAWFVWDRAAPNVGAPVVGWLEGEACK